MDGLANAVKIKEAEKKGAVAVLFLHDQNIHNGPASDIWGNPTQNRLDTLPAVPVVSITKPDGAEIRRLLKEGHVKVRVESTVVNEWRKCPLLIADLECPRSDKFILFSGHIDSWDYGAMDNGSANATMIECARLMAQRKDKLARGLRIAFWSGHSQGKYAGSAWYADHHFEELRDRCAAHLNIDSGPVLLRRGHYLHFRDVLRAGYFNRWGLPVLPLRRGKQGWGAWLVVAHGARHHRQDQP